MTGISNKEAENLVNWGNMQFALQLTGMGQASCGKTLRAFLLPFPRYVLVSGAGGEIYAGKHVLKSDSKPWYTWREAYRGERALPKK